MENERELPVKESLVQEIIAAVYARHEIEHRNCDYEVCEDAICAAGLKLETDTGIYEEWSQEEIDAAKETAGRWKQVFETPDFANQVYEARIDTGIRQP